MMSDTFSTTTGDQPFKPQRVIINGYMFISSAEHDRRVTELLDANNREVERRRIAERELHALRKIINKGDADELITRQEKAGQSPGDRDPDEPGSADMGDVK